MSNRPLLLGMDNAFVLVRFVAIIHVGVGMMKVVSWLMFLALLKACSVAPSESDLQMVQGYKLQDDHDLVRSTVSLINSQTNRTFCSATLIHKKLLVTAAHCIYGKGLDDYELGFFLAEDEVLKRVKPSRHKSYKKTHKYDSNFDIAWIALEDSAPQPYEPLEVWNQPEQVEAGTELTMGGYGQLKTHCSLGEENCFGGELYFSDTRLQEYVNRGRLYHLLLVGPTPGRGPCFGDSGGPLLMRQDGQWFLLGNFMGWDKVLVQEDDEALCENGEAIYNAVGSYVSWIEKSSGISLSYTKETNERVVEKVSLSQGDFDQSRFLEWCLYDDIHAPSWYTTQTLIRKAADFAVKQGIGIQGRELLEDCALAEFWLQKMIEKEKKLSFTTDKFAKGNFDFRRNYLRCCR